MNAQRLKLLAVFFMIIDHLGMVLNTLYSQNVLSNINDMTNAFWQMRVIGRLAFPIFCFLIAEGCAHTKDIKKYIRRLAIFAIISQIPYQVFHNMLIGGIDNVTRNFFIYTSGNVLETLTLGAVSVFLYSKTFNVNALKKILFIVGIIFAFVAVLLLRGEYDLFGVLLIFLLYVLRKKNKSDNDLRIIGGKYVQVFCCALLALIFYILEFGGSQSETIAAVSSALLLLIYNGQPGNRKFKLAFYLFYPAHLIILSAVLYIAMI